MEKYFKRSDKTENDMFVVENVNAFPVRAVARKGRPMVTNISVDEYWDCLSTYEVARKLISRFDELYGHHDLGLCSYLAQCIVNPMWEAKTETRVGICDMTMIFGNDFVLHDGRIIHSEEVWNALTPYIRVIIWQESNGQVEIQVELNVE